MKSVIKTNINQVQLAFKQEITELKGNSDMNFLKQFVEHCHKNAQYWEFDSNTIEVGTKKNYYLYSCFSNYIRKINKTTGERTFFKIS